MKIQTALNKAKSLYILFKKRLHIEKKSNKINWGVQRGVFFGGAISPDVGVLTFSCMKRAIISQRPSKTEKIGGALKTCLAHQVFKSPLHAPEHRD